MTLVYLSLGSNIEPEKNILEAIKLLSNQVKILKASQVYLTQPLLQRVQPEYYNCVLKVETDIGPHMLKHNVLRVIEEELGRKRTRDKYASRTIDIDILLYGNEHFKDEDLEIPDPEIENRAFLAILLCQVEPQLVLPVSSKPVKEIAHKFRNQEIAELKGFSRKLRTLIKRLCV